MQIQQMQDLLTMEVGGLAQAVVENWKQLMSAQIGDNNAIWGRRNVC